MLRRCLLLVAFLLPAAAAAETPPVKLAVLVVFDQMRADYLTRWNDLYGEGGFRRLEQDGAWFRNCNYPYSGTVTGAGHASLATGRSPWKHGVFNNEWYDRDLGRVVYCATTPERRRVPPVPPPVDPDKATKPPEGGTPERLVGPTLADAYKEAAGDRGRVVALSGKDRGAVFLGGRRPDACYWIDGYTGEAITSTYYRDRLESWVEDFNHERLADRYFGKDWTRLRPDFDYEKYSGPDDQSGESLGYNNFRQGRTFPHPMDGGLKAPGREYYETLYASPFGNDLLLELVKRAITAEKLGTHDVPDLLCVSFSSTDPVGHAWGPDSQEVLDGMLRADRVVKGLLDELDANVGKGRYVVVLSADHGVCPLPEVSAKQGREARRVFPSLFQQGAEEYLQKTFGREGETGAPAVEKLVDSYWYLNRAWIKGHGLDPSRVEEALAGWLTQQTGVARAYTRTQLLKGVAADDEIGRKVWRSFYPDRGGDVTVVMKPYYLLNSRLMGTFHGSPYGYDTNVPLVVYGPGVQAGVRDDAVTPQAAVPILAHVLGVKPPAGVEAATPADLFKEP